ncbi:XRE family transcriptional regulator [Apilactobacillus micheneri]|nr:XRE family transcriptional regulator [Apilactobacillus micheneri]
MTSIAALSRKTGLSDRTIQKYVSSIDALQEAKYSTVKKLADGLNIKVNDIFLDPSSEKQKKIYDVLEKIAQ